MKKAYVVISRPAEPSLIKDENFLKNKNASQIEKDLNLINEKLYITTPFIRWPLDPNDIPLDLYPQIIIHENPGKFTRPDYYLTILPSNFDYTFYVNAQTEPEYKIPAFEVSIKVNPAQPHIQSDVFLEAAQKQFQLEASEYQLLLNGQHINDSIDINQLKDKNLSMRCKLSEKSQFIVRTRINIIQEIQTTENTYITGLTKLNDQYRKDLLSNGLFNRDEDTLIFRNFPSIIGCHQMFMDSITKRAAESPYGAIYSDVFLDFSAYFKISLDYITNYHKYISLIVEKSKDKDWKKKLETLSNVYGSLQSYLITPVQRMPRYILFLRELIKYTPSSHPDSELLKNAADSVKEITAQIDEAAIMAENKNTVLNINSQVENFNLLDSASRVFLIKFDVHINRNSRNLHNLYVFNDLILLTKIEKNCEKEIYNCEIQNFRYIILTSTDIVFYNNEVGSLKKLQAISLQFQTENDMYTFKREIGQQKEKFYEKNEMVNNIFSFQIKPLYPLNLHEVSFLGCNTCIANNCLILFFDTRFYLYNDNTLGFDIVDTNIPARLGYSLSYISNTNQVLMFGGILENGSPTNELWALKVHHKEVQLLEPDSPPEARFAHTGITVQRKNPNGETEDFLVIFGGLSKKKKSLNDTCIYNPLTNIWLIDQILNNSPKPRSSHAAAYTDHSMYIYGGITDKGEYLSDFYSFGVDNFQWQEIKFDLPKKAYHQMIFHDNDLFIFGGNDGEKYSTSTTVISRDRTLTNVAKEINDGRHKWSIATIDNCGEDPALINRFLIERINDHFVMIVSDHYTDKNTVSAIFHIKPPIAYEMKDLNCDFGNDPFVDSISSNPIQDLNNPMPRASVITSRCKTIDRPPPNASVNSSFQERVMKLQNIGMFNNTVPSPLLSGKPRNLRTMAPSYTPILSPQEDDLEQSKQVLPSPSDVLQELKSLRQRGSTLNSLAAEKEKPKQPLKTDQIDYADIPLPKDQYDDDPQFLKADQQIPDSHPKVFPLRNMKNNRPKPMAVSPNQKGVQNEVFKNEPKSSDVIFAKNNMSKSGDIHTIQSNDAPVIISSNQSFENIKLKHIPHSSPVTAQSLNDTYQLNSIPSELLLGSDYDEHSFASLIGVDLSQINSNSYQATVIGRKLKKLYSLISENNNLQKKLDGDSSNDKSTNQKADVSNYLAKVISKKDNHIHLIKLNSQSTVDNIKNECGKACGFKPTKVSFKLSNTNIKEISPSLLSQLVQDVTLQNKSHITLIVE